MSLDINKAALQLFNASSLLQKQYSDNTKALDTAVKAFNEENPNSLETVSYTHLRAHET